MNVGLAEIFMRAGLWLLWSSFRHVVCRALDFASGCGGVSTSRTPSANQLANTNRPKVKLKHPQQHPEYPPFAEPK